MAADLRGLRSVVELMADQVTQLIALGGRQIEAFASLPPALAQSTKGLSDGLRQLVHAIHALPHRLPPVTEQASGTSAEATQKQAVDAEPAPVAEPAGHEPLRRTRGTRTTKGTALRSERTEIVVKSISDAKRSGRFYTSVRLPRQLWDQAGFGPEDRLLLDWDGSALSIERTSEGGVTPKSIGGKSVVLQSWKLGNLNFDSPSIAGTGGFLRLVGNQR
ncbi:MAG: hypothetical protein ABW003_14710 [Microvirga sp.]